MIPVLRMTKTNTSSTYDKDSDTSATYDKDSDASVKYDIGSDHRAAYDASGLGVWPQCLEQQLAASRCPAPQLPPPDW